MDSLAHRSRAQESRAAVQRLYIAMRHLFIRGSYKPLGLSGDAMIEALKTLQPEIYGAINDPEQVELNGLLYVFQRLPRGIEECRYVRLITREGYEDSGFEPLIPPRRKRNCYRIDTEQMFVEMTRGRSDIYDILTHLTFMYIEAEKIRRNSEDHKDRKRREWAMLETLVDKEGKGEDINEEVAYTYLSVLLGRTYQETLEAARKFAADSNANSLFHVTYWLGRLATEEHWDGNDREISFSAALREKIGHHILGEIWAANIKNFLHDNELEERPLHIISANMHSVMNCLYAPAALKGISKATNIEDMARELSMESNADLRKKVRKMALQHGMYELEDNSGTNIPAQIFDLAQIDPASLSPEITWNQEYIQHEKPILFVMDYAFGEQAFETFDELFKPYENSGARRVLPVKSIGIMGKAGILEGDKGDLMIPTAHVFEGTADNYPIDNDLSKADFEGQGLAVFAGPMITVMGTSLQNKDILHYFLDSSWGAIGLEMEGAHYQKAIQAHARIRQNIPLNVALRYAYYASDNPLETGSTLASGSLGLDGVKPTYLISIKLLNRIVGGAGTNDPKD
jgi:hypothetical protein